MKKKCDNCKALEENNGQCYLGYKNKHIAERKTVVYLTPQSRREAFETFTYYKPLEECPKPITLKLFARLHLEKSSS